MNCNCQCHTMNTQPECDLCADTMHEPYLKLCEHGLPLFQICWECQRVPGGHSPLRKEFNYALKEIDDKLLKIYKLLKDKNENSITNNNDGKTSNDKT